MPQPSGTQRQPARPSTDSETVDNTAKNARINDPASNAGGDRRDPNAEITPEQARAEGLPEQLHAGAVGYGPAYANQNKPTIGEKFTGVKEQLIGKLTKNPELAQKGHEKASGELKKKEQAQEETDPFAKPEDKKTVPGHDSHDNAKARTGADHLGGGKSDTAALQKQDPPHPTSQEEISQRDATV